MNNIFKYSSFIMVSALLVNSCKPDLKAPEATEGTADFAKYIAVGNSLTAGYADGGLYLEGQKVAYPNLIAEQMKLGGLGANDFASPNFSDDQKNGSTYLRLRGFKADGSPRLDTALTELALDITRPYPVIPGVPAPLPFFLKKYNGGAITNFGVPGIRLANIVNNPLLPPQFSYGNLNPFFERFIGNDKTISYIDMVSAQNATFFSFWLGNNDVLGYATSGGTNVITPTASFSSLYELAISKMTANGAKGVVATIPDVTSIPYFTTVKPSVVKTNLTKAAFPLLPAPSVGTKYVVCYRNNVGVLKEINDSVMICLTADSIGKSKGSLPKGVGVQVISSGAIVAGYPLDNSDILEYNEQILAKNTVTDYNNIIVATAAKYNLALYDANAFLANVKSGVIIDGTSVSSTYISGGAFSLDGVHLTPRGNAMAANGFIDAINAKYGSNISKLTVTKYKGVQVQ